MSIYNQLTKGGFPVRGLGVRLTVFQRSEMRCLNKGIVLVSLCIYLIWGPLVITVKLRTSQKLYKDKIREFRKIRRYNAVNVNNAMEIMCDDLTHSVKRL